MVPQSVDISFLSSFRKFILENLERGFSFYIIAGGGKTARNYQDAANEIRGTLQAEDADWLGIHATRLNAHLLRTIFLEHAQPKIVKNPARSIQTKYPIIIGAGFRPGHSTDYCAVIAAKKIGAKKIINLSNTDYVYDSDPNKNPQAKKIEKTSWKEFRKILPTEWSPGLSSPFDPIAAKEAEQLKLEVANINGARLEEFQNYIDDKPFMGTIVT